MKPQAPASDAGFPQRRERSAVQRVLSVADRWRYAGFAGVAAAHAVAFTGRWRPGADSAELLALGRAWRQGRPGADPDAGDLPGYPWLLAALGDDPVFPVLLLQLATTAAWLTLWYLLLGRVVGRPTAVLVTVLSGVAALGVQSGAEVLPDAFFAAGVAAALWGAERVRGAWARRDVRGGEPRPVAAPSPESGAGLRDLGLGVAGLGVGVAVMSAMRTVAVVVAAALIGAALWGVGRRLRGVARVWLVPALAALSLGGFVAAWWWVPAIRHDAGVLWGDLSSRGIGTYAAHGRELLGAAWPEAAMGIDPTPWVGLGLSLPWVASAVLLLRVRPAWGLLVAALLVQWVIFLPGVRYVLPALPLVMLAGWRALRWMHGRVGEPAGGWLVYAALGLWGCANVAGTAALAWEQRATADPSLTAYRDGKYAAAAALVPAITAHAPADAVVVTAHDVRAELAWWTGRRFVRHLDPAEAAGFPGVYAVGPLSADLETAFEHLGWSLGPALAEHVHARDGRTWGFHAVRRPGVWPDASPRPAGPTPP